MGIRVAVIDDNPHLGWNGRTYPANATFHRFLSAVLDVTGPDGRPLVAQIDHCVPLRPASVAPRTLPLDPRLNVVATAPFDGIEGYLRHAPGLARRNAGILRPVIREADLVWIKVPASNASLAATLAAAARKPRFGYVAGSAADVVAGQRRHGVARIGAAIVGRAYDGVGRLSSVGGDRVVVGRRLAGDGIVTSLVEAAEIRSTERLAWPRDVGHIRLAWAGRLVDGKGVDRLLTSLAILAAAPARGTGSIELTVIGDGPAWPSLEALAAKLGVADLVDWRGYKADRAPYLDALAAADLFVFPSTAEGFPKVVLDAMAAGLPVLATPTGALEEAIAAGAVARLPADPPGIAAAIDALVADPARARVLLRAGTQLVTAHTRSAEATRLVERWQEHWPNLPWG